MKLLTFTTLYPNGAQPQLGLFVESRLRRIVDAGSTEARVLAPVPWFPFTAKKFGRYADFARVQRAEWRFGIQVDHPTYPVIPKCGMHVAPYLMFAFLRPYVSRMLQSGYEFDLIDAHYFYPDGVAASMLGRHFKKPVVITARGSDINLISRYRWPRYLIRWAAENAAVIIAVCDALKGEMERIGIEAHKVHVLRNGVDLDLFRPLDREQSRERLGVAPPILLMVGNLVPLKGHELAIRALSSIPDTTLLIVGQGPEESTLKAAADAFGLGERVRFLGTVAQSQLPEIYSAADALLLPSASEGMANVLLEAMACGTPIIPSDRGGNAEVMSRDVGILLAERSPQAIAQAVRKLWTHPLDRVKIREHAMQYNWGKIIGEQLRLYAQVLERQC